METVIASNEEWVENFQIWSGYGYNAIGQTFTSSKDGILTRVEVMACRNCSEPTPENMYVRIYNTDNAGLPIGDEISGTIVTHDILETMDCSVGLWNLPPISMPNVLLKKDIKYALVLSFEIINYEEMDLSRNNPGTYSGGESIYFSSGAWVTGIQDFVFRIYGEDQICYWIIDHGGNTAIDIVDVFQIIDNYIFNTSPAGYTFVPTLQNVFGVIDYYLGFFDSGNQKTGCFLTCEERTRTDCELPCFWWNGSCHSSVPICNELNNETDCTEYNCFWYNGSCYD